MKKAIYNLFDGMRRGVNKVFMEPGIKKGFRTCGDKVKIGAGCELKPLQNISVGSNVEIGPRALFWTTKAKIKIGNRVMFGPGVTIITGDHPTDIVGKFIMDIHDSEKPSGYDEDVVIEDDVWVGCNVTILKGVHIGRGAVIAAGSVVTKNVDEFGIYAGVPARKIKDRFTEEELVIHRELLKY